MEFLRHHTVDSTRRRNHILSAILHIQHNVAYRHNDIRLDWLQDTHCGREAIHGKGLKDGHCLPTQQKPPSLRGRRLLRYVWYLILFLCSNILAKVLGYGCIVRV